MRAVISSNSGVAGQVLRAARFRAQQLDVHCMLIAIIADAWLTLVGRVNLNIKLKRLFSMHEVYQALSIDTTFRVSIGNHVSGIAPTD